MDIKTKITDYVKNNPGVTYVEIEHLFDECGFSWKGNNAMCSTINDKIILWSGWNKEACTLLNELQSENLIQKDISNVYCYMVDGKTLNLPIVKNEYEYKTEHWLPIEFKAV